jgi:GH15 family glucan-1,4-alpha-glucosidase
MRVALDCRAAFGSHPMSISSVESGVAHGTTGALHWRWSGLSGQPLRRSDDGTLDGTVEVAEGEHLDLVLEIAANAFPGAPPDPDRLWTDTEHAWRTAVPPQPNALTPRDAQHALAVLRGMTSRTGGMVAAATTSLPERAQQGRDYDYRYAWIRDQCFAGRALAAAHECEPLHRCVQFVASCINRYGAHLAPMYTVTGDPVSPPRPVRVPGYPGAPDVKAGNRAHRQFQLDVFGEALLLFAEAERLGVLDDSGIRATKTAAHAIVARHAEPDAGIWELEDRRWAHSRLAAAGGLRAAARRHLAPRQSADWNQLADRLVNQAARDCTHHSGRWQRSPNDPGTDAALLLPALRGAVPPEDPHSEATRRSVFHELTEDGYVYRFRQSPGRLHEAEGAFLLCGFLLAMASSQQGDGRMAARLYERNRAAVGPPGLFTEEFDVEQRQLRGNLPQAFVHAALLESAYALTHHDTERRRT